jgi:hypothetical protein
MSLKDKRKYIRKYWNFVGTDDLDKEYLLSNDGRFIFNCI